jgi:hypothetical protein
MWCDKICEVRRVLSSGCPINFSKPRQHAYYASFLDKIYVYKVMQHKQGLRRQAWAAARVWRDARSARGVISDHV